MQFSNGHFDSSLNVFGFLKRVKKLVVTVHGGRDQAKIDYSSAQKNNSYSDFANSRSAYSLQTMAKNPKLKIYKTL